MYRIIDSEFVKISENMSVIRVFILCDTSADVPEPPEHWDSGSICRIANERKTLILNNAREWV